jgi:hypothetical protein
VDVLSEGNSAATLVLPSIVVFTISESQRPVPTNTRDTMVQIDLFSNNSQLEVETIYERVIALLSQLTYNQGSAHVFWQLLAGGTDDFESERRIWHRSMTIQVWSIK